MWKSILLICVLCPLIVNSDPCDGCGDYKEVDVDDETVKKVANEVFQHFSDHFYGAYRWKIANITQAEEAKCSNEEECGKAASYRIKVTAVVTKCLKKEVSYKDVDECEQKEDASHFYCKLSQTRNKDDIAVGYGTGCSQNED
ncbi:uncharacterized protein [Parasteatoda tepidariorum]|uniref:uncharacterized protein n=1 Tax=Parasteatoda tepidariorum TaxID=114398 RepID=UPI001C71C658|nr:uncharacterized protein LOC107440861 [Parasteatoda tepidariorum]